MYKWCTLLADASSVGLPSVNLPSTCHTCLSTYNRGEIQTKSLGISQYGIQIELQRTADSRIHVDTHSLIVEHEQN